MTRFANRGIQARTQTDRQTDRERARERERENVQYLLIFLYDNIWAKVPQRYVRCLSAFCNGADEMYVF
jgi:hypothetical protein